MKTTNKKITLVTTSWDDGHILDLKLAALLKKYNLQGTFYVSPKDWEFKKSELLTNTDVKNLSKNFEIGGHTINHPHLSQISVEEADKEIKESKKHLEKVIGKKILSFCYPYGDYSSAVEKLVEKNGFILGRTVKRYSFGVTPNHFGLETTFHTFNHARDIKQILQFAGFNPIKIIRYINWEYLAKDLFDYCLENNLVFHLWGHSWEIDQYHDWERLERVFKYIANRKNVKYITNAELII